jgi:SNF2 family DNA or RNA helicase
MAGAEGINLQAAKAFIFYDLPWSAGDYLQLLGRMIRIGSRHQSVYAIHLVVEDSIDLQVEKTVSEKMGLITDVIGQRIKGDGEDGDFVIKVAKGTDEIFSALRMDALKMQQSKRRKG